MGNKAERFFRLKYPVKLDSSGQGGRGMERKMEFNTIKRKKISILPPLLYAGRKRKRHRLATDMAQSLITMVSFSLFAHMGCRHTRVKDSNSSICCVLFLTLSPPFLPVQVPSELSIV